EEPPNLKKPKRKSDLAISSEETPSKKKPTKDKKDVPSTKKPATNPKPNKKNAPVKAKRGKSDGTDFQSGVPNEQQRKISGTNERTSAKLGVPDLPKYDSESDKESWGDSGDEDDDGGDDTKDDEGNDDGDDNDGDDDDDNDGDDDDDDNDGDDDDDNDGDDDDNDGNDDDDSQFNEEHEEEEEEEKVDEFTDKEDDEEELDVGEELYKDVNVNLRKEDVEMTDADQKKLLNFENVSPTDNEIASLMDTIVRHEEPSDQTYILFTVPITVIPTTIPPPPHLFNPLPQQATPTPTPETSEAMTSFPALPDFSSIFKFNDRVTKLETDVSDVKQVDQYAQAISSIPAIVDHYINNKLREVIHKAIQSHNAECREEAQAKKQEYIDLVDTSMRTIIKEEVKTQLPQILPKAVSDFATPVIERNILLDKMEERKSHLRAVYKRELYDALVNSYNTDNDLFNTYGEVFTLKRSRDDKYKDQDPSARSDRGTKRRKSSKEAELFRDPKSKESKSTSSSKCTSHSYH
ncbi:hypothetical protein Tco_1157848, partial [Tanacetum coccineum]